MTLERTIKSLKNDEQGMTLIDIAIALTVIGLLAAGALSAYNTYRAATLNADANVKSEIVQNALKLYYFANGFYPCPADPSLPITDLQYGVAQTAADNPATVIRCLGAIASATTATMQTSENDGAGGTIETNYVDQPQSYAGMVPFKTLNLEEDAVYDIYNKKLTYVVSASKVFQSTYDLRGSIIVRGYEQITDATTNELVCTDNVIPYAPLDPAPNDKPAHFLIVAHGENGVGAYNRSGVINQACGNNINDGSENINCNHNADNIYWNDVCSASRSVNGIQYDDKILYMASTPSQMWTDPLSTAGPDGFAYSETSFIGIKTENPDQAVHVIGDITAQNGEARANVLCDITGEKCASLETILGETTLCTEDDLSSVMSGFGSADFKTGDDNAAICDLRIEVDDSVCNEALKEAVIGFDFSGNPICGSSGN